MKKPILFLLTLILLTVTNNLHAQGTAFAYQGQLQNNGSPANGTYDVRVLLFNAVTGGSQVGTTQTNLGVSVTNGLFTVIVDFGPVFTGSSNAVRIDVRTNGASTFTQLLPRQQLTPTPYAIFATSAGSVSGAITTAQISGVVASANFSGTYGNALTFNNAGNSFTGNGGGLTGLNASQLTSGTIPDAQLANDVALLDVNQTFSGINKFTGSNQSIIINGNGPAGTNIFTGLGLYYDNNTGEGAIMSSFNDVYASLNFYTKPGPGVPATKQVKIDRYGSLFIDQQNANYGALNDGTTNGAGLVFGTSGGEGIASQRTAGVNKNGLDFYTSNSRQMSILNNGKVGIGTTNPSAALQVIGTVNATAFAGNGSGLTNLNASQLAGGTIPDAELANDVALLDANQTFTGTNIFKTGGSAGALIVQGGAAISTGLFQGLSLQYNSGSGEGAIISSYNDDKAFLSFYTKAGPGMTILEQAKIDRYGNLMIDQQNANSGAINTGNTSGVGLIFGTGGGEGIASQRTAGVNKNGLDFYTGATRQMSILNDGNVGIGTANPSTPLQVIGTVNATAFVGDGSGLSNLNVSQITGSLPFYSDTVYNFFAGPGAGDTATVGMANTAIGGLAMHNSQNDNNLVAVGYEALMNDNARTTNGSGGLVFGENTAIGYQAMEANSTGTGNTAVGYQALELSSTGTGNTAMGAAALTVNTGLNNTAIGYQALAACTGGFANTAIGYRTLNSLQNGFNNVALGVGAGSSYLNAELDNIDIGSSGVAGENAVIHIGSLQTDAYLAGTVHANAGLNVDFANQNTGTLAANALIFGNGSGEGIASKRSGNNDDDLEFYTGFNQWMTILNSGTVGIVGELNVDSTSQNTGTLAANALVFGSGSGEGIASRRNGNNSDDLELYTSFSQRLVILNNGNVGIGTSTPSQPLQVIGNITCSTITITGGSDLAEPFKITSNDGAVPQGTVVVIDDQNPGHLKLSEQPYDPRVAGVISGANGIKPGIQMQQQGLLEGGQNVALTGRVYVQADASNGPIQPGDLLTTSSTPGRAMKVTDHLKAQGAILGKAMSGLSEGKGMVLVLVTLQ